MRIRILSVLLNAMGIVFVAFGVNLPQIIIKVSKGIDLQVPRALHTATRLSDGKILLVGGSRASDAFLAEVEIFNPITGLTPQAASLHTPRHGHTATLLPDGRELVVGGYTLPQQWLADAEVYDPSSDTWRVIPPLFSHGVNHTATLMKDGRVLIVGGCIGDGICTNRVEIFDPQTNAWLEAKAIEGDRASQTAQLLEDGRVLVAGGGGETGAPVGGDALLYDPQTNTWTATGSMVNPRSSAQSVLLPDGRVLVAGGMPLKNARNLKMTNSAEIYDPALNKWKSVGSLSQPRYAFGLMLLPNGKVLAIGGSHDHENNWRAGSFIHRIECFDTKTNRWKIVGTLTKPMAYASVVSLSDGRIWVAGGRDNVKSSSATWLIAP